MINGSEPFQPKLLDPITIEGVIEKHCWQLIVSYPFWEGL